MTRTWAAAMVVAGLVAAAGCATGTPPPVVLPTERALVAQWQSDGGFVAPGTFLITPPKLAVYSDGTAIAGAQKAMTLRDTEVADLVRQLRADLAGIGPTALPTGRMQVADAPTDMLQVRAPDGGMQSVSAYALGIAGVGYPESLVHARATMADLATRVATGGSPFTSDRIKLVVTPNGDQDSPGGAWPQGVTPPTMRPEDYRGVAVNLGGPEAAAAMKAFKADSEGRTSAVLPDGTKVWATWRYLLPHE